MQEKLNKILPELPKLLAEKGVWDCFSIGYHPPQVIRLSRIVAGTRVCLHTIFPCEEGEALWHAHGWPMAVEILEGFQEVGFGRATEGVHQIAGAAELSDAGTESPAVDIEVILGPRSQYALEDPWGWHYVRPLIYPSYSVMVNGAHYEAKQEPRAFGRPLTEKEQKETFSNWEAVFAATDWG